MYHLNPQSGAAGPCRARAGYCPFSVGSERYSTIDEARADYESIMAGRRSPPLSWLLSKTNESLTGSLHPDRMVEALFAERKKMRKSVSKEAAFFFHNYTMDGYERVNAYLRGQPPPGGFGNEETMRGRSEKQIKSMDSVFAEHGGPERVVYRFITADGGQTVKQAISAIEEAGDFHDDAYVSTSASVDYPLHSIVKDTNKPKFLLEIASRGDISLQGRDCFVAGNPQSMESEILLPRGLTFEVAGVEMRKKVEFGPMKETFFEHGNFHGQRERSGTGNKLHHVIPVVKLVQKDTL